MSDMVVPAGGGLAFRLGTGERLRITTPAGAQAADFFAFMADDIGEWLSPMNSWVANRSVRPQAGDVFLSRHRAPMVDFVADGAGGVHDMLLAACDQNRYAQLGFDGPHASCAENLMTAMRAIGVAVDVVPQPVNFFTNTRVDAAGALHSPPNPVPPGAHVDLKARRDLICAVSSCPFDLPIEDWTINAPGGPTELHLELHPGG